MASPDVQDIYQHIKHTAENIVRVTKGVAPTGPTISPCSVHDHELVFTETKPIFASLVDGGLPVETSERLSNLHMKMSNDLRDYLRNSFKSTWSKVAQFPTSASTAVSKDLHAQLARSFRAVYEQKRAAWAAEIQQMAFSRLEGMRKQDKRSVESSRHSDPTSAHKTFNYVSFSYL